MTTATFTYEQINRKMTILGHDEIMDEVNIEVKDIVKWLVSKRDPRLRALIDAVVDEFMDDFFDNLRLQQIIDLENEVPSPSI